MVCDGWFLVLRSLCKRGWQMVSTTTTLWMVWRIYFLSPAIGTTTHYYASLPWQAFIQHIIQNQKPLFQKNPAPATIICQDILMEGVTIAKPQSQLNVYANVSSNNNPSKWIQWMLNMAIAPWHSHHLTSTTAPSWRPQAGNPPHFSVFRILGEIQAGTWGWNTHTKKWPTAQIETKKMQENFSQLNKLMAKKIGFHPFPSELFIGTRCGRALDGLGAFQHASCIPLHLGHGISEITGASLVGKAGF